LRPGRRTEATLFDDLDEEELRKLLGLKKMAKEDLAYLEKHQPVVEIKSGRGAYTQETLTNLEKHQPAVEVILDRGAFAQELLTSPDSEKGSGDADGV
jgi:hypothetical protein